MSSGCQPSQAFCIIRHHTLTQRLFIPPKPSFPFLRNSCTPGSTMAPHGPSRWRWCSKSVEETHEIRTEPIQTIVRLDSYWRDRQTKTVFFGTRKHAWLYQEYFSELENDRLRPSWWWIISGRQSHQHLHGTSHTHVNHRLKCHFNLHSQFILKNNCHWRMSKSFENI